jgi:hypothetical protein
MTKVFLGGSRRISWLPALVRDKIDNIVLKKLPVVIGDANGADKLMQEYLSRSGYKHVEVFCSNGICRNNVGAWHVRSVPASHTRSAAEFYSAKDQIMASESDIGLMLWDGKSIGTLANALRLVRLGKKVVIYCATDKQFRDIRNKLDWREFINECGAGLQRKVEQRVKETPPASQHHQASILG